jgi:hypothetical protein
MMRSAMDQKAAKVEEVVVEEEEGEEEEEAWEKNDREWLRVTLIELLRDANLSDLDLLRSLDKDSNQAVERKEWMRCIKRIWVPPPPPKVVTLIAPASHKIVASSSEIVASSSSEIVASSSELISEMIPKEEVELISEIRAEIRPEIRAEIRAEIRPEIRPEIRAETVADQEQRR